jgi:hypothetical protein
MCISRFHQFEGHEDSMCVESCPRGILVHTPITRKIDVVAYKLKLPERLSDVHNIFHVSQLRKCLQVSEEQVVPDTLNLQEDLRYHEVPIKILDTMTRRTRTRTINLCKGRRDMGERRCA